MKSFLKFLFNAIRFFFFGTSIYALSSISENPNLKKYKCAYGKFKFLFLTKIALFLTVVSFILVSMYRFFFPNERKFSSTKVYTNTTDDNEYMNQNKTENRHNTLYKITNFFLMISFVYNILVVTTFWPLYFIDKSLIVSKTSLNPMCRTYLFTELSSHLFPIFSSFLEQFDIELKKRKIQKIALLCFLIIWCIAIHIARHYIKRFLYGFLNMNLTLRLLFFVGVYIYNLISINIILFINKKCYTYRHKLSI